jgi:hypothetical protein
MPKTFTKMVAVGTTKDTWKNLEKQLIEHKDNVDPDKMLGHPYLNKSALCHAIFTAFVEDPEKTMKFLNINK